MEGKTKNLPEFIQSIILKTDDAANWKKQLPDGFFDDPHGIVGADENGMEEKIILDNFKWKAESFKAGVSKMLDGD